MSDLPPARRPLGEFVDAAARDAGVPRAMITGEGRDARVVAARWRWMAAAYAEGWGSPAIGRAFGKDHTSVLHALRRARG